MSKIYNRVNDINERKIRFIDFDYSLYDYSEGFQKGWRSNRLKSSLTNEVSDYQFIDYFLTYSNDDFDVCFLKDFNNDDEYINTFSKLNKLLKKGRFSIGNAPALCNYILNLIGVYLDKIEFLIDNKNQLSKSELEEIIEIKAFLIKNVVKIYKEAIKYYSKMGICSSSMLDEKIVFPYTLHSYISYIMQEALEDCKHDEEAVVLVFNCIKFDNDVPYIKDFDVLLRELEIWQKSCEERVQLLLKHIPQNHLTLHEFLSNKWGNSSIENFVFMINSITDSKNFEETLRNMQNMFPTEILYSIEVRRALIKNSIEKFRYVNLFDYPIVSNTYLDNDLATLFNDMNTILSSQSFNSSKDMVSNALTLKFTRETGISHKESKELFSKIILTHENLYNNNFKIILNDRKHWYYLIAILIQCVCLEKINMV